MHKNIHSLSKAKYQILNIGNNSPVTLDEFLLAIENACGKRRINNLPMQDGDVLKTYADIDDLQETIGFKPSTSLEDGITKFVNWYKTYHKHEKFSLKPMQTKPLKQCNQQSQV